MPVPAVPAVDFGSAPNGHRVFSCFEMSRSVRYLFRHQEKPLWLVYGAGRTMACSRGGWSKFYQLNCASAQALPHPISPYLTNRLSMSLGLSTQCSVKCFSQNILRNTYKSSPLPKFMAIEERQDIRTCRMPLRHSGRRALKVQAPPTTRLTPSTPLSQGAPLYSINDNRCPIRGPRNTGTL